MIFASELVAQLNISEQHNIYAPTDVNGDGFVRPSDALVVIDNIAAASELARANGEQFTGQIESTLMMDTNNDGGHQAERRFVGDQRHC